MKLSAFGEKFAGHSGIVDLMDDLGSALNENPDMIFMGGGNPARIPHVEEEFQQCLENILNNPDSRHSLLGIYQSPQGERQFRSELAQFLNKQFGWQLSAANIAISNGSQAAFFILFNLLAGKMADGSQRQIHLPLAPEYIGYGDTGLSEPLFSATKPNIEHLDNRLFKYHVDFSKLQLSQSTAALCVSRPTNPTGNVLTDDELAHLSSIAKAQGIPLIIDGAYGLPFPNILFCDAKPHWDENTILALSLSKLGLPGARTGIIVANEELIQAYTNANTITSLACGNLGPAIAKQLFTDDKILSLSNQHVKPFYQQRSQLSCQWFQQALQGLNYHIHKPEGAIFLWLWFEGLPISSQELYQRLKARGVLVVPGHNFFVGIADDWQHQHECIRASYAQPEAAVKQGISIIAEEVRKAYQQA
ncbi:valine--pyruvate transaminase [Dasania sp. GY-MA-18]|uniref:Valine--pyruvate transaminase n=1 Tax=Dasania phycosphaerae TaxID=2950436 RepID=A0A9J6RNF3_9GAMM|nr:MULTISPECIES: valine--pyruvate transaminase [Dasania]MCR8923280.1 valine--pyruvate transaminase [Dasania sp. GY-MA-18]MCZ0865712.1 valine--pyruvate transaminase [Dasania phycosphaerae]MCZ0869437.1 valine--pyruvate transaminase [Dasania phycosphaerae]